MRIRRFVKPLLILTAGGLVALTVSAWLIFQHVPKWYQPRWLSSDEMRQVQREFDASFDQITRSLAAGQPFTLSFTADQLNDVIAAQPRLWPAARDWLGPHLSTPRLRFDAGGVQIGVRHTWGSIQSIVNARLTPQIAGERLIVALDECRAGSLRLPISWLGKQWASSLGAEALSTWWARTLGPLLQESRRTDVRNRFYWPNGDIPFKIENIELDENLLTLHIRPSAR